MTIVIGIIFIIAQIIIGVLYGLQAAENRALKRVLRDQPDEPVHWYILYDESFETAIEMVQCAINTYEEKGCRVINSRQDEGTMWFQFDIGHEIMAIDVTEEWDFKLPKKGVRPYVMIDSTIDGELTKGIMEKIGATNTIVQFLLFNNEGEE